MLKHSADRERGDDAVVIAAPQRRIEKEVPGLFEADNGAGLVAVALHVGVAGFPVIAGRAVFIQHRVRHEQASRFDVGHEFRVWVLCRDITGEHDADFVGKDGIAVVIDYAAAVAVAIECKPNIRSSGKYRLADGVQHAHVLWIWIVMRKRVVELAIKRHNFASHSLQNFRRKRTCRSVTASGNNLQPPLQLCFSAQGLDVSLL